MIWNEVKTTLKRREGPSKCTFVLILVKLYKGGSCGVSVCTPFIEEQHKKEWKAAATWLIGSSWDVGPVAAVTSVLFAALRVELEQQPQGGEAEQEGLGEPHATSGHAVNALVSVQGNGQEEGRRHKTSRNRGTYYIFSNKNRCARERGSANMFILFVYNL